MSDQTINVVAKVNTTQVKDAKVDFAELKAKVADLGKEIPGLGSSFGVLGGTLSSLSNTMTTVGGGLIGLAGAAVTATAALGALGIAMAFKGLERVDALSDSAQRLGLSADQFYFYSQAAKDAGGTIEEVIQLNTRLAKAMANSGVEMKGVGAAFQRLGVDTTDTAGKLKSQEEVLDALSAKWEESGKTASDYADMQQILGKSFEEQLNTRNAVKESEQELQDMYEKGIGITKKSEEAINDNEKANRGLGAVLNSMGSILVEAVIPAFTTLTSWFVKSYTEGGIVAKVFTAIVLATEALMAGFKIVTAGLIVLVEAFSIGTDVIIGFGRALWDVLTGKDPSVAFGKMTDNISTRIKSLQKDLSGLGVSYEGSALQKVMNGQSVINQNQGDLSAPRAGGLRSGSAGGDVRATDKEAKETRDKSQDAITRLIESLTAQTRAQENLNKVDLVSKELQDKKFADASKENKNKALALAATIDQAQANKLLSESAIATKKIGDQYVASLNDEIEARTMSNRQLKEQQELRKIDLEQEKDMKKLKDAGLLNTETETRLLQQNADARLAVRNATESAKKADEDWVTRGLDQTVKKIGDVNDRMTDWVSGSLTSLSDGLASLASGGEFSFRSFAASIVKELLNMTVQFLVIIPIITAFKAALAGSSMGGLFGSIASLFGGGEAAGAATASAGTASIANFAAHGAVFNKFNASGGIMPSGSVQTGGGNVGNEAGQEGVLPLRRNAAGDLGVMASISGGGGGNTQVNNITINSSGSSNQQDNEKMAATISAAIDKKWQENNKNAQRAGGVNNRVSLAV